MERDLVLHRSETEAPKGIAPVPESGLTSLPENQQAQLKGISQDIVNRISEGPSSLIDQNVIEGLTKLGPTAETSFWKLMLSPSEGWKALTAMGQEAKARAKLRSSVAQTQVTLAKIAEEDMDRKVFASFIDHLRTELGPQMQIFCREHQTQVPQEGTQAEIITLLRMHSALFAMANYREALQDQMIKWTREKAKQEGDIALSLQRAAMLKQLIKAREEEYPEKQKAVAQKSAHIAATGTGAVTSFATGVVLGAAGGVIVATAKVRGDIQAGLMEAGDYVKEKIDQAKENIERRQKERAARKNHSN